MPLYRLLTVLLIGVCCITCSEVVAEEQKETNAYERDFKHGNNLLVLGKYQQAIKVGKSGLLKDPQNVVLLKILSVANFGLRKFKAAYDRCYQAVEFAPYDLGLHDIFIDVAVRLKNVKTNELLRFVIRNDPEFLNHPSIQQQLPTYPWIRKFNASRMEFVIAMAYTDVCLEHSQQGNHKLAERMISYAIELTPSDQEYYELRARERIQNRHRCLGAIHDCIMSFKYGNRTRFPFTLSVLAFGELIVIDHEVAQLRTLSITSALSAYLMSSAL